MVIEIVHHNRNATGFGEVFLNQFSHAPGPGYSFKISPHIHPSSAIQRRIKHEQMCRPVVLILTIIFKKLPKPVLIEALAKMGRINTGLHKAKKGDLVPKAVRLAKGTGWIPAPLQVMRAIPEGQDEAVAA